MMVLWVRVCVCMVRVCGACVCVCMVRVVCVAATAGQTGFLCAVVMAAAGPPGPDLLGPAGVSTR